MINAYISPKTAPADTEFPGTFAELVPLVAQYLGVGGLNNIIAVNIGPSEPNPEDRDKPWFKITAQRVPMGWFGWDGSAWLKIPDVIASGATEDRPTNCPTGQVFLDTTIKATIIFERGMWRTIGGSPGDVKFVATATLADALTANPGWAQFDQATGRVIGAAGAGSGLTERAYGATTGAETVSLAVEQIPPHVHNVPFKGYSGQHQNGPQPAGIFPAVTGTGTTDSSSIGGGQAHDNMQPTLFLWCLIKQ